MRQRACVCKENSARYNTVHLDQKSQSVLGGHPWVFCCSFRTAATDQNILEGYQCVKHASIQNMKSEGWHKAPLPVKFEAWRMRDGTKRLWRWNLKLNGKETFPTTNKRKNNNQSELSRNSSNQSKRAYYQNNNKGQISRDKGFEIW